MALLEDPAGQPRPSAAAHPPNASPGVEGEDASKAPSTENTAAVPKNNGGSAAAALTLSNGALNEEAEAVALPALAEIDSETELLRAAKLLRQYSAYLEKRRLRIDRADSVAVRQLNQEILRLNTFRRELQRLGTQFRNHGQTAPSQRELTAQSEPTAGAGN
jgi:hypothetical protein